MRQFISRVARQKNGFFSYFAVVELSKTGDYRPDRTRSSRNCHSKMAREVPLLRPPASSQPTAVLKAAGHPAPPHNALLLAAGGRPRLVVGSAAPDSDRTARRGRDPDGAPPRGRRVVGGGRLRPLRLARGVLAPRRGAVVRRREARVLSERRVLSSTAPPARGRKGKHSAPSDARATSKTTRDDERTKRRRRTARANHADDDIRVKKKKRTSDARRRDNETTKRSPPPTEEESPRRSCMT